MAEAKNTAGKNVAPVVPGKNISSDELSALNSFDDALRLVQAKVGETNVGVAADEIGDGFKLLDNKDQLIGVPFIGITWDFHQGDHGEFVSLKLMTKDGLKFIVNDGSTGLRDQLIAYSKKKNTQGGLFCEKGFRRSDYTYTDEKGKESPATTYYLDTSA
jgi:hypothetical protein